mgnify:CR=1 FL=1|tara:strand:- start:130 stop:771 length:642 start_codon:yes stop_codon:yes gene_type:complete
MTTRKQLAERILRIIQGGDLTKDSDIDIREIMLHVDSERDAIVQAKITEMYKPAHKRRVTNVAAHEIIGTYISEQTYSTSFDSTRSQRYATLACYPIDMPDNSGVLFVTNADDSSVSFAKMQAGLERAYSKLPSLAASRKAYYVQIGDRIYFDEDSAPSRVNIGLIALSSSLSDTATYPLSPGDESTIIKSVVDLYNVMSGIQQDNVSDNIDI